MKELPQWAWVTLIVSIMVAVGTWVVYWDNHGPEYTGIVVATQCGGWGNGIVLRIDRGEIALDAGIGICTIFSTHINGTAWVKTRGNGSTVLEYRFL